MSMINEFVEKLIERLEELKKAESDREDYSDNHDYYDDWEYAFEDGASDGRHYAYVKSIKIIKELAEEYKDVPDTNVGKWIPVSEKLPDEESEVIVSTKTERVKVGIYTKKYGFGMREGFMCDDGFMYINTANAWQPLSEPYKGE